MSTKAEHRHSTKPLLAIPIFLLCFLGSGFYFFFQGVDNPWYQISPTVAVMPAIAYLFIIIKNTFEDNIALFIKGLQNKSILSMCLIFILAGALGEVTRSAGSVEASVDLAIHYLPTAGMLPCLFLIVGFISTSMGSAMGAIAALSPIAVGLAQASGLQMDLVLGTVVGGAMLGDNLSLISDTTIAAVQTQQANLRQKFILNAKIAGVCSIITIAFLWIISPTISFPPPSELEWPSIINNCLKVSPFLLIIFLAIKGWDVVLVLVSGILYSMIIGVFTTDVPAVTFIKGVQNGFQQLWEVTLLSLLIGGMTELMQSRGGLNKLLALIKERLPKKKAQSRRVELLIGSLAGLYDICLANNTIAIILSGPLAKNLADQYKISAERSACWIDCFSCAFQGILPYSAQILLASSIAGLSPLTLCSKVYYCYILLGATVGFMMYRKKK